jgi:hypothetical protein
MISAARKKRNCSRGRPLSRTELKIGFNIPGRPLSGPAGAQKSGPVAGAARKKRFR